MKKNITYGLVALALLTSFLAGWVIADWRIYSRDQTQLYYHTLFDSIQRDQYFYEILKLKDIQDKSLLDRYLKDNIRTSTRTLVLFTEELGGEREKNALRTHLRQMAKDRESIGLGKYDTPPNLELEEILVEALQ